MAAETVIHCTQRWLDDVVIKYNFCPFARFVREPDSIHYQVCSQPAAEAALEQLYVECARLDEESHISTTLFILPQGFDNFDDYLDLLELAQELITTWGYDGVYQLASFHPQYRFAGEAIASATHFTNRSPFPILHLIREADITRVLKDFGDPQTIFTTNMQTTTQLGAEHFSTLLAACKAKTQ
ncbi:DUF1415 domain-containing protein [Alteromonas pelagimontana]|uniref:DUF1415 domain-containing protein n=1 Tax=Alteromonas pelagimontana TaxID=1858656 RepID=A0A6N3IVN2_9ALTE|nr:DUF1415 domain-containing protein [Alteromonas pelagimontana]